MYLLRHRRTAARPKCWRSTMGLSPTCSCDTSNIIWKPFMGIIRWLIFYPVPAPKVKFEPLFLHGGSRYTQQWELSDFDFFTVKSEVCCRVCALLSVRNWSIQSIHYSYKQTKRRTMTQKWIQPLCLKSVLKKINQVVVTRHSVPSKRLCACVWGASPLSTSVGTLF